MRRFSVHCRSQFVVVTHKPGIPMRPIVSFCGSPTYQLSKYSTTILQPLTDKSRRKLQSTENVLDAIKTVQIPDDYKLVSCGVVNGVPVCTGSHFFAFSSVCEEDLVTVLNNNLICTKIIRLFNLDFYPS